MLPDRATLGEAPHLTLGWVKAPWGERGESQLHTYTHTERLSSVNVL